MIKSFYGVRRGNYHELSRHFFICIKINTDDVTNREIMRDVDVNEMGERVCKCVLLQISDIDNIHVDYSTKSLFFQQIFPFKYKR